MSNNLPGPQGATRRQFLGGAGAALAFGATSPGQAGAATAPTSLDALVYPIDEAQRGVYPEQAMSRYSASSGKWGVAFSGGGPRSFSASVGQMRGLTNAGVIDSIGAISCVSGGTWFGTTYTFAPSSITDAQLLGPIVQPADESLKLLGNVAYPCLTALTQDLADAAIVISLGIQLGKVKLGLLPSDKVYSRILNDLLLFPYGLADETTLFTLNSDTQASIQSRNPTLKAPFQLPKADRPFLIAGATQIYQPGAANTAVKQAGIVGQIYRTFEYTPLYTGAARHTTYPRACAQSKPTCMDFGGGYVESFAFDTPTPTSRSGNAVTVPVGAYPFLLSDVMGSSSAAFEAVVETYFKKTSLGFPEFDYWPIADTTQAASEFSFGDGGIYENTGVVALLRRGYRTIFAFVNSPYPIGSKVKSRDGGMVANPACVDGIDGDISRLFGHIPRSNGGNAQSTQVFKSSQFKDVANGLKMAQTAGGTAVYAGLFPVVENNSFGIAPYTPQIFWIYNDRNASWYNQLPTAVKALFDKKSTYNLTNFPNYATVLQNKYDLLYLTPTQVNLLADMWAYAVSTGFATSGSAFGYKIV